MKKLLLSFAVLLSFFGVKAQNDHFDTLKSRKIKVDSIRVSGGNPIVLTATSGASIVFMGTSITAHTGPNQTFYSYSTTVVRNLSAYGVTEENYGVSGSDVNTDTALIPVKTAGRLLMVAEWGTNNNAGGTDTATFRVQLDSFFNICLSPRKGWLASQMYLPSLFGSAANWNPPNATYATQRGYNAVTKSVCAQYGANFIECYEYMLNMPEISAIGTPLEHPFNEASVIAAGIISGQIKAFFNPTGQSAIVNGTTELGSFIYKNRQYISNATPISVDTLGNIGVANHLPNNFILGTGLRTMLNGSLVQVVGGGGNWFNPSGVTVFDSTRDQIWSIADTIHSGLANNNQTKFVLYDQSGGTILWNMSGGGTIKQIVSGGTNGGGVFGIWIQADGHVYFGNTLTGGPGGVTKTGSYGGLDLFNAGSNTNLYNAYGAGSLFIGTSNGTSGSNINMTDWTTAGRVIVQQGGTYTELPWARLTVNSTSEGVVLPSMSIAQRNTILLGGIINETTTAGTGYTNGTYNNIALTGGTGSGALGNFTITGGGVTGFSFANKGVQYKPGDVLTVSNSLVGGSGTGWSLTATVVNGDGALVYDTTTNKFNWWNGKLGKWMTIADTTLSGPTSSLQQVITQSGALTSPNTITNTSQVLTFTGGRYNFTGTANWNPSSAIPGSRFSWSLGTTTDTVTAASGTVANAYLMGVTTPTLAATNTGVVYTNAYTFYINASPFGGTNVTITNPWALGVGGNALFQSDIYTGHELTTTAAPSIAAGTGAGTSPTLSVVGTDQDGDITVTTGTAPTLSAAIATITYFSSYTFKTGSVPIIYPANAATALLTGTSMVFTTGNTGNWVLTAGTVALTGATTYKWHYKIGGY